MKLRTLMLRFSILSSTFFLLAMSSRPKGCDAVKTSRKIGGGVNDVAMGRDAKFYREKEQYQNYYDMGFKEGYSKGLSDGGRNNSYNPRPEKKPLFAGRIGDPIISQSEGWSNGYYRGYDEGYSEGMNNMISKLSKKSSLPKTFSILSRE